jgi:hypothetical protein
MGLINIRVVPKWETLMIEKLYGYDTNKLQVIPEEMIIFCAKQFPPQEENTFRDFLKIAYEFKVAGLTPIYLSTYNLKDLFVTTQEKIENKLH